MSACITAIPSLAIHTIYIGMLGAGRQQRRCRVIAFVLVSHAPGIRVGGRAFPEEERGRPRVVSERVLQCLSGLGAPAAQHQKKYAAPGKYGTVIVIVLAVE